MTIEHIAMYVNDLEAARDFFVKYLGGRSNDGYHNKTTGFRSYFISFDDGARLELMNKPELRIRKNTQTARVMLILLFHWEVRKKSMK